MVVLGGLGSIWGVVLGALVLSGINTYLLPKLDLSLIASGIYGLLLVVMVVLRPQGLVPELRRSAHDHDAHRAGRLWLRRADLPRAAAGRPLTASSSRGS